jgi:hypothetical protein
MENYLKLGEWKLTALRSFLMSTMGFLLSPLWNLDERSHHVTPDLDRTDPSRENADSNANSWRYGGLREVPSAGARGEELDEVVGGHVEQRVEVHATVAVLAERPLLGRCAGGDLRLVRLRGKRGQESVHLRA